MAISNLQLKKYSEITSPIDMKTAFQNLLARVSITDDLRDEILTRLEITKTKNIQDSVSGKIAIAEPIFSDNAAEPNNKTIFNVIDYLMHVKVYTRLSKPDMKQLITRSLLIILQQNRDRVTEDIFSQLSKRMDTEISKRITEIIKHAHAKSNINSGSYYFNKGISFGSRYNDINHNAIIDFFDQSNRNYNNFKRQFANEKKYKGGVLKLLTDFKIDTTLYFKDVSKTKTTNTIQLQDFFENVLKLLLQFRMTNTTNCIFSDVYDNSTSESKNIMTYSIEKRAALLVISTIGNEETLAKMYETESWGSHIINRAKTWFGRNKQQILHIRTKINKLIPLLFSEESYTPVYRFGRGLPKIILSRNNQWGQLYQSVFVQPQKHMWFLKCLPKHTNRKIHPPEMLRNFKWHLYKTYKYMKNNEKAFLKSNMNKFQFFSNRDNLEPILPKPNENNKSFFANCQTTSPPPR